MEKCGTTRQATDDSVIWRIRFACWIPEVTDTLRICNIYCFSRATVVTGTPLSVTCSAYIVCLVRPCKYDLIS